MSAKRCHRRRSLLRQPGRRSWNWYLIVAWAIIGVSTISVLAAAFHAPFDFDEAYNLQVSKNLADGTGYATDGVFPNGPVYFDPLISTGPPMLVPIAVLIRLLGSDPWVFRLVPVVAYASTVILSAKIGRRLAGEAGACAASAGVIAVSTASASWPASPIFGAGDVLGEYMAVALIMSAALLHDKFASSGFLIGLAVMTKFLVVLVVPGFIFALLLPRFSPVRRGARSEPNRERVRDAVVFITAALTPALLWQCIKIFSVGWHHTLSIEREFINLLATAGSGISTTHPHSDDAWSRLAHVSHVVPVASLLLFLISVAAVAPRVFRTLRAPSRVMIRSANVEGSPMRTDPAVIALTAGSLTIAMWWLFISSSAYTRHVVPAVVLISPIVAATIVRLVQGCPRGLHRGIASACAVGSLAVAVSYHGVNAWKPPGPTLADQAAVANRLEREQAVLGWTVAVPEFELGALGDFRFTRLDQSGLLVLGPVAQRLAPERYREERSRCGRIVIERAGFVACYLSPPSR